MSSALKPKFNRVNSHEQITLASATRLHPVKGFSGELVVLQVNKFGSVPSHWRLPSTRKPEPVLNCRLIPRAKSRPEKKKNVALKLELNCKSCDNRTDW